MNGSSPDSSPYLVDMYNSNDLNDDIHSRLSSSRRHQVQFESPGLGYTSYPSHVSNGEAQDSGDPRTQVGRLLAELDCLHDENRELKRRLQRAELENERLREDLQTQQMEMEAVATNRAYDLIESIHEDQRTRDDAVMDRLRLANKERDLALEHVERVSHPPNLYLPASQENFPGQSYGESPLNLDTNDVEELEVLLRKAEAGDARHRRPPLDESVLREAVLAQELAEQRCKELEDELQTLRIYHSLQKALGDKGGEDVDLRRKFDDTLGMIEAEIRTQADKESDLMTQLQAAEERAQRAEQLLRQKALK